MLRPLNKLLKVIKDPRLAAALLNAQLRIGGKARVPLSVRLNGKVRITGGGEVGFGEGITLIGKVVPIEFVPHKGARIVIGDRRRRFTAKRVDGLLKDATRPSRVKPLTPEKIKQCVQMTLHKKPPIATPRFGLSEPQRRQLMALIAGPGLDVRRDDRGDCDLADCVACKALARPICSALCAGGSWRPIG